jgi:hypothetical protein
VTKLGNKYFIMKTGKEQSNFLDIGWHILLGGPVVSHCEGDEYPYKYAAVKEVVAIGPDAPLSIPASDEAEDVHDKDEDKGDPAHDGVVEAVVEGRKG